MPTPGERRALLFFASIAVLGAGWRAVRGTRASLSSEAERSALGRQIAAVDSARLASSRGRRSATSPSGSGVAKDRSAGLVDVDRATAGELEALPRIGPALARRIIADRDSNGPFGSLDALQRVRGVGPAMAREIAPKVTFSAPASSGEAHRVAPAAASRIRADSGRTTGRGAATRPKAARGTEREPRPPALWPIPPPRG
jgi:competence protein ComEA